MRTVVIIQARMGSTRLPGKVLMDLGGKPVLAHVVERCKASGFQVVVATTKQSEDDAIMQWCWDNRVDAFRGEVDPLQRLVDCAERFNADVIVRVCGDSPFLHSESIAAIVRSVEHGADYSAYRLASGKPVILTKLGLTCEAVTRWCLECESVIASGGAREHVTKGIYTEPRPWSLKWHPIAMPEAAVTQFAIDTQEDLDRARERWAVTV